MLQHNCTLCIHRNPVIHDELAGDPVPEQTGVDRYADVRAVEAMTPEQRWKYFEDLIAPCIRCYACRNACPLCYCPTCFVDESRPQWVGKSQDPSDVRTFHFLRAYHCAGRCTDCGACERACPVGINMRMFTKKLEKDCLDLFGWEAGLTRMCGRRSTSTGRTTPTTSSSDEPLLTQARRQIGDETDQDRKKPVGGRPGTGGQGLPDDRHR